MLIRPLTRRCTPCCHLAPPPAACAAGPARPSVGGIPGQQDKDDRGRRQRQREADREPWRLVAPGHHAPARRDVDGLDETGPADGQRDLPAVGLAAEPPASRTDAPDAGRPGSTSRLSGPRARWSTKTANEPSWPAYPHRGGTSASCSCPLATNTFPFVSVMDSGPRWLGLPPTWATTAIPVTGCGRLIASREALGALAANQRVGPPAVMSPIWVPAAASGLASASGTSSRDTRSGVAKYQVALWFAAMSRCPVPDGPAAGSGPAAGPR